MLKTLLAFSAAALLAAPCLHAQGRHGDNFAAARGSRGDFGRRGYGGHGYGRYYYFGGVPYFYPFDGFGFDYGYGFGIGYNVPYGYGYPGYYGDEPYEGRIVQDSAPGKGGALASLPAAVQQQLAKRGYYKGAIDGEFGPASRGALSRFQEKNGLSVTGRIDEPTLMALGFSDRR